MVQSSEGRLGNDAANGLNCTRYRRVLAQRYVRVSETLQRGSHEEIEASGNKVFGTREDGEGTKKNSNEERFGRRCAVRSKDFSAVPVISTQGCRRRSSAAHLLYRTERAVAATLPAAREFFAFTFIRREVRMRDEARRIAVNISNLPELLQQRGRCTGP